jgi:hypothetical protein
LWQALEGLRVLRVRLFVRAFFCAGCVYFACVFCRYGFYEFFKDSLALQARKEEKPSSKKVRKRGLKLLVYEALSY